MERLTPEIETQQILRIRLDKCRDLNAELLATLKRTIEWMEYLQAEYEGGDPDNYDEISTLLLDAETAIAKAKGA